jgi:glucokinase
MPLWGAMDIGGTKTALAVVNSAGAVVRRVRLATPVRPEPEALCVLLAQQWRQLIQDLPGGAAVRAVGVAVPGPADAAGGILHQVFDWPWHDVPVARLLEAALGLPVRIENDVNCCCLSEQAFGAARGVDDFAWVQISTGVGAGLVLRGRLYAGATGLAGEVGHLILEEGGPLCACGRRGCLQALVSGPAIARRWREASRSGEALGGGAEEVFARAAAGDALAQGVVAGVARDLGRGLAMVVNILNPALVVVGGGVVSSLRAHLDAVAAALRDRVIGEANRAVPVVATAVGYDAALLGAAVLVSG